MSEKIPEWSTVWGAKVKTPTDLPDNILEDAITTSKAILSEETDENVALRRIKEHVKILLQLFHLTWRAHVFLHSFLTSDG